MMKIVNFPYFSLLILLLSISCKMEKTANPLSLPAFGKEGVNVVIEIPAGSSHKIEINKRTGKFKNDQKDGKNRVIDFLPYPANYGFIPSTLMDKSTGGDGDALDVLVISESLPTGTVLEIIPIGALMMTDGGEIDTKIIGVPVDSTKRIIQATDFEHFLIDYNMAQNIIQDWFLNYKGLGKVEMKGWFDEKTAMEEIRKWELKVE
jgi:inorganic pyrophosphatase